MNTSHAVLSDILAEAFQRKDESTLRGTPSYIVKHYDDDYDTYHECFLCDDEGVVIEGYKLEEHFSTWNHRIALSRLHDDLDQIAKVSNRYARLYSTPAEDIASLDEAGQSAYRDSVHADLYCSLVTDLPEAEADEQNDDLYYDENEDDIDDAKKVYLCKKRLERDDAKFKAASELILKTMRRKESLTLVALAV
jgi:hypothetical protein